MQGNLLAASCQSLSGADDHTKSDISQAPTNLPAGSRFLEQVQAARRQKALRQRGYEGAMMR